MVELVALLVLIGSTVVAVLGVPLGSWTLLNPNLMLVSGDCRSPFANGEAEFVEDRVGPPNRAYKKLWTSLLPS